MIITFDETSNVAANKIIDDKPCLWNMQDQKNISNSPKHNIIYIHLHSIAMDPNGSMQIIILNYWLYFLICAKSDWKKLNRIDAIWQKNEFNFNASRVGIGTMWKMPRMAASKIK